jgi:D-alanyl-D-alanine carboxypeptidase
MRLSLTRPACLLPAIALLTLPAASEAATPAPYRAVERGLERLVAAPAGPPGVVATFHRGGRTTVLSVGRANVRRRGRPRGIDHMRIASVAKAYSGAIALNLVRRGRLGLDDTIGQRLPSLPVAWHAVTIRQLLNHTSGMPDYTESEEFAEQLRTNPGGFLLPTAVLEWVSDEGLLFPPGSSYRYSNSDNIIIGLIAEAVTGDRYEDLLTSIVFRRAGLTETTLPAVNALPRPFIHGYLSAPGEEPEDVSTLINPSGAWASGGIVSTPVEVGRFFRAYLGGRFFGAAQKRAQRRFVRGGQSSPPGPGTNAAGLALFRYRTRCGTVYGHTGSYPGYAQWAAASADGKRSVTTSLNIPPPTGALLARLRRMQAAAVCALLRK